MNADKKAGYFMKAIVMNQHGGADTLKLTEIPTPQPKGNEVLVKIHSAGLNHVDIWVRNGGPAYPVKLPHVLGADGAGVVEALGPDAEGVSVGDRVYIVPGLSCGSCSYCKAGLDNQCETFEILGTKRNGTYAEYVVVPDQNVSPLPSTISFETGAAFPLAYLTAWHMLQSRAKLLKGETLLVIGASAGVGIAAIQIGKLIGAKVWAVSTSADKIPAIKKAGADEVFLLDAGADFSTWVREKTHKQGVNVVFEHVGPATFEMSLKSLAKYGRLVTCGATTGPTTQLDLRYVFSRDLSILGARMGTQKELQAIANAVFSGKISPLIYKSFKADEVSLAHQTMEDKKQVGKILLTF